MTDLRNVIIVGSGPAGFTAAIYASRANLEPLMLEGEPRPEAPDLLPGGQLMLTTEVENYPGFPEGITGPDMMDLFRKQALRFGTEVLTYDVARAELEGPVKKLWTTDGKEHHAKAVIISTGASAKWLGLESETALRNRGVSACATCDGAFFRNKVVAVVGGGDTAMEEATFLTRFASKVLVIHRREELRASKIMQDRAKHNDKIEFVWNSEVVEVLDVEAGRVTGLRLKDTRSGDTRTIECGGLFLAIGHKPNTGFLEGQLDTDELGYVTVKGGTRTNIEGVFAAGDVSDKVYRQAITAAGMGCQAAIDAERWLETQE
ncbi:thioredoxin-disulfide reductase [Engelhardtia mirabilis]|uniref:Thioredoxin reductase n=1 Tax=Engelhardtia mirabilis TaxID=2528011 RepID=A0A518BIR8_9BACT|nr:Thioredoxin reductase [Planctomycetes bacterium Pla133]QDV01169.1 Thioredoxin reductase [Planctomycetes bacterium Pla86]